MTNKFDRYEANLKESLLKYKRYIQMEDLRNASFFHETVLYPNLLLYKRELVLQIHFGTKDIYYWDPTSASLCIYLKSYRRL
jgi:hypothetical protein